jgi:gluconate 2-dehydrogenase gamma chain
VVAVGLGGAGALHSSHQSPAHAEAPPDAQAPGTQQTTHTAVMAKQGGPRLGAFFNETQAPTVEAIAERIMPGAPGLPGARDANVLNYIDLALAGAYADLQDFYRRGLAALDEHCRATYGRLFRQLEPAEQDAVLQALQSGEATGFTWPTARAFFDTLWIHTMEGMFSDPIYGGNQDFAGWRLIEFPGAQPFFTVRDMQTTEKFTRAPMVSLQHQYDPSGMRREGE